jgi:hypothetical protein
MSDQNTAQNALLPDWNNPSVLSRNRIPPRAYAVQFPDYAQCSAGRLKNRRYDSPYVLLLNGEWEFRYCPHPSDIPTMQNLQHQRLDSVAVPSCWQTTGYDRLQYVNIGTRFPGIRLTSLRKSGRHLSKNRPYAAACARDAETDPLSRVLSAFYLYVNGRLIGYSEGKPPPRKFDITSMLHEGDNDIQFSFTNTVPDPGWRIRIVFALTVYSGMCTSKPYRL